MLFQDHHETDQSPSSDVMVWPKEAVGEVGLQLFLAETL